MARSETPRGRVAWSRNARYDAARRQGHLASRRGRLVRHSLSPRPPCAAHAETAAHRSRPRDRPYGDLGERTGILPFVYVISNAPQFANYPFRPWQAWLGAAVFAASLWLFYRTHKDLGRNWSVTLEVREQHALVTTGVYRRVRHPMYSAFWLWALAQALLLPNWIAGPAGLIGFGTLFFLRVGREEALMIETFGEEYRRYMARSWRLLPGIY